MCLEAVQLLYTVWFLQQPDESWRSRVPLALNGQRGYKPTHKTNPLVKWIRQSSANYHYVANSALKITKEYTKRYRRTHAVQVHAEWLKNNLPPNLDDRGITPIPLIVGVKPIPYASSKREAVTAYRKFYRTKTFLEYPDDACPPWLSRKYLASKS